ncbi:STM2901 family protein [Pantoea sp. FN0307]|uniref:STM2901 family protein n=1 Tax=Pantoea sp. FN0307 TaxID=3418560 RepID=UPI003CEAE3D4
MDTTEQLGGTYFYGGLANLSAGELFFWIMIDVTAEHFTGAKDVIAAAAVYSGANQVSVTGKFKGATKGTSYASQYSRKMLKNIMLPFKLPTWIHSPTPQNPFRIKKIMTMRLATFTGRTIPVIGWLVLATDVAQIAYEATVRYNRIANQEGDKLW